MQRLYIYCSVCGMCVDIAMRLVLTDIDIKSACFWLAVAHAFEGGVVTSVSVSHTCNPISQTRVLYFLYLIFSMLGLYIYTSTYSHTIANLFKTHGHM